jgi:hypothetical protein
MNMGKGKVLKAIRRYCLECCCNSAQEIRLCPSTDCPLWPWRFGKRPTVEMSQNRDEQARQNAYGGAVRRYQGKRPDMRNMTTGLPVHRPLKAIRERCIDCCGYSALEVRLCPCRHGGDLPYPIEPCSLWPYRFGKDPDYRMTALQMAARTGSLKRALSKKNSNQVHGFSTMSPDSSQTTLPPETGCFLMQNEHFSEAK